MKSDQQIQYEAKYDEAHLHNLIVGRPELVRQGLVTLVNRPKVEGDEVDLLCLDLKTANQVFVELKYANAGAGTINQLERYLEKIRRIYGEKTELVLYCPYVPGSAKNQIESKGIQIRTFDIKEVDELLSRDDEAREVLDAIARELSREITTRKKFNFRYDLLEACFVTDYIEKDGHRVYKGLRNQTLGTMIGAMKSIATGPWYETNPSQAIKLIDWVYRYPFFGWKTSHRGGLVYSPFCVFLESQEFGHVQELKKIVNHEVPPHIEEFLSKYPNIPDPLVTLGKSLVAKKTLAAPSSGEAPSEVSLNRAVEWTKQNLGIDFQFKDGKDRYYADNSAVRILELALLRGVASAGRSFTQSGVRMLAFDSKVDKNVTIVTPISLSFLFDYVRYREPESVGGCNKPHPHTEKGDEEIS